MSKLTRVQLQILNGVIQKGEAEARIARLAERERARLDKLASEDPYFVDADHGDGIRERWVNLRVSVGQKTLGKLEGVARLQIPAARGWAKYCSRVLYPHKDVLVFDLGRGIDETWCNGSRVEPDFMK